MRDRIVRKSIEFLKQGITPQKLALTLSLGIVIGIFPIVGTCTLICTLIALILKLNLPAIQLVNYSVSPFQFFLIIPYVKLGEYVLDYPSLIIPVKKIIEMAKSDLVLTLHNFGFTILLSLFGWLIISVPLFLLVYFIALIIFRKLSSKKSTVSFF